MSHRAARTETLPFDGPVSRDENRAAHGNVCLVETCKCGARRRTNINQRHEERGAWHRCEHRPADEPRQESGTHYGVAVVRFFDTCECGATRASTLARGTFTRGQWAEAACRA